jgi:CubicO group peptidase (beta-lactamase class C family)
MRQRKHWKRVLYLLIIAAIGYAVYYLWISLPIINGYDAKMLCSCVFVQGRDEKLVLNEDLGIFPQSIASNRVNLQDSSVTTTILGLGKRKAVYRKGFGCALVNDIDENELRSQKLVLPPYNTILLDSIDWPQGNRTRDTLFDNLDRKKLQDAVSFAFENRDQLTRAVVILYKGKIVAERYGEGISRHTRLLGWSMAKSITGTLVGLLVQEGRLDILKPAPIPHWKNEKEHSRINVEHLLQQTSGIDFEENYTKFSPVTNMLFNKGDMAEYAAGRPVKYPPGTVFNYSGGNSNILSFIVRKVVGEDNYHHFPYRSLFQPIGMHSAILETDAAGNFVGSSYVHATALDYARYGLFYLQDGVWNGKRFLPEDWVRKTSTPAPGNPLKNYGYQFWLNGWNKKDHSIRDYPSVPADMYYADGYGGQRIFIIPSRDLVVVRMGLKVMEEDSFLKNILASFSQSE